MDTKEAAAPLQSRHKVEWSDFVYQILKKWLSTCNYHNIIGGIVCIIHSKILDDVYYDKWYIIWHALSSISSQVIDHGVGINSLTDIMSTEI